MEEFVWVQLKKDGGIPLYVQLFDQLKNMIGEGLLEPGRKLPPIRRMAEYLGVNSVTVINAYKRLEQKGYVHSKVGSGTYVLPGMKDTVNAVEGSGGENTVTERNLRLMDQGQIEMREEMVNFASMLTSPGLFPVDDFKKVLNEVLERDGGYAFGYEESQGYYPLRKALVEYVQDYGINCQLENIQVITGAQQGIDIVSKALLGFGDCVFVENPTYSGAIAVFRSRNAKIIGSRIEKDGICIDELERNLKLYNPSFIYVMPGYQNPTGYSYSEEKRKKLISLANEYNLYIVENDSMEELCFHNRKRLPLKAVDREQRIIYIKSFSKVLMPGIRLGFIIVPSPIQDSVLAAKHSSDISTSGLIQRAFELFLRRGLWQKQLLYMKEVYSRRFAVLTESLKEYFPNEVKYSKIDGGMNLWFALPEGCDCDELHKACLSKNVLITPGSVFFINHKPLNYFRLSFASAGEEDICKGIKVLGEEISNIIKEGKEEGGKNRRSSYTPLI